MSLSVAADAVESSHTAMPVLTENNQVSIYIASWCPHCSKAKDYLDSLNIPYVTYDIETPMGQEKFETLHAQGIPIIVVGDLRMDGFNPIQLEKALCKHSILNNCSSVIS